MPHKDREQRTAGSKPLDPMLGLSSAWMTQTEVPRKWIFFTADWVTGLTQKQVGKQLENTCLQNGPRFQRVWLFSQHHRPKHVILLQLFSMGRFKLSLWLDLWESRNPLKMNANCWVYLLRHFSEHRIFQHLKGSPTPKRLITTRFSFSSMWIYHFLWELLFFCPSYNARGPEGYLK